MYFFFCLENDLCIEYIHISFLVRKDNKANWRKKEKKEKKKKKEQKKRKK